MLHLKLRMAQFHSIIAVIVRSQLTMFQGVRMENIEGSNFLSNPLLSRKEAARYLGLSEQTLAIWKCTKRHDLPFVKIGRLIKYRKVDLDSFISKNLESFSSPDVPLCFPPRFN